MTIPESPSRRGWLIAAALIAATAALAIWIARCAPSRSSGGPQDGHAQAVSSFDPGEAGVWMRIRAGDVEIERAMPAPMFDLEEGQTLDPRLPPGPFSAEIRIPIDTRTLDRAVFGAEFAGGRVVLRLRGGTLIDDAAGREARTIMSQSTAMQGAQEFLTCTFERIGDGPARLRILWQPQFADDRHAVLVNNENWPRRDEVGRGLALVQTMQCAACHRADDPEFHALLDIAPAPILSDAGARLKPAWLRQWLRDPAALKRGATMPRLFDLELDQEIDALEDIVHYLASLGGPFDAGDERPAHPRLAEEGMLLFHAIGCVACHGEVAPGREPEAIFADLFINLPGQAQKTSVGALASFLLEPASLRPAGRMPSLRLTSLEAQALAAYLVEIDAAGAQPEETGAFIVDPQRAARGRALFIERGCQSCHDSPEPALAPNTDAGQRVPLPAPAFESIARMHAVNAGCIAAEPDRAHPVRFDLPYRDRAAIHAFLDVVTEAGAARTGDLARLGDVAAIHRLNCLACHQVHDEGGPHFTIRDYFRSLDPKDLTDEGRLPPALSDAGARLHEAWMRSIIAGDGRARPHMAARMPKFRSDDVQPLIAALRDVSGGSPATRPAPAYDASTAEAGRLLIGIGGLNCIECHSIASRPSTGLPGVDLVQLPARINVDYFRRMLLDPDHQSPGTRMPKFFVGGRSAAIGLLDGDARRQIDAMWMYLHHVDRAGLPDGLPAPGRAVMTIEDDPLVIRAFLSGTSTRVVAVGTPSGVHHAFDIGRARPALVWRGDFYTENGPLAGAADFEEPLHARSGGLAGRWQPPQGPTFLLDDTPPLGWQLDDRPVEFEGYELDDAGLPVFRWHAQGAGGLRLEVRESIRFADEIDLEVPRLFRRLELSGEGVAHVWFNAGGGQVVLTPESPVSDTLSPELIRVDLDENGRAAIVVEITLD